MITSAGPTIYVASDNGDAVDYQQTAGNDLGSFVPELVWVDPAEVILAEQPRGEARARETDDLARSARAVGFSLSIITVFRTASGDWQLVSGERRLRQATSQGLARIPAFDLTPLPEERRHLAQGLENSARAPLTLFEYARYVVDRKVVADILALSMALGCLPPPLAATRKEREMQLESLHGQAAAPGIALRPPNLAAWWVVEDELSLDESKRKRLVKLAQMPEEVAAALSPLELPQDNLLELADWPERELRLVAEAIVAAAEPPRAKALHLARLAAEQLRALPADKKGVQRAKLRDSEDAAQLLASASEVLATSPAYTPDEQKVQEVLTAIIAFLAARYRGRHLPGEAAATPDTENNESQRIAGAVPADSSADYLEGENDDEDSGNGDDGAVQSPPPRQAASPGRAWVRVMEQLDDTLASIGRQLGSFDEGDRAAAALVLGQMAARIDEYRIKLEQEAL